MSEEIISVTAKDGSVVEYVKGKPSQGAMKDVYFSPDRSYVVAFFRKKLGEPQKVRLNKIVGDYADRIFKRIGGEYWRTVFCWPEKIIETDEQYGIVMPAYRSNFIFQSGYPQGQEKEGKWWASAKNYNYFVPDDERGTLGGFLNALLELSRAVRRMHAAGLSHSDLSYKNCLIDPKGGRGCLIDVDGLVVPGMFPPDVLGTKDFMASEIVATSKLPRDRRVLPSRDTDKHALAVLIYMCLFHRHPLRGDKVHSLDPQEQEFYEMGERALFIEHPSDSSNRLTPKKGDEKRLPWCDPVKVPYACCGPYLKSLFDQAFIRGLHDPLKRPSAEDWEYGLAKTLDLLLPCSNPSCKKREFVFDGQGRAICPYCETQYQEAVPILEYLRSRNGRDYTSDRRKVVVHDGKELFLWHVDQQKSNNEKLSPEERKRVAYFSKEGSDWVLHNENIPTLRDATNKVPVPVGSSIALTENLRLSFDENDYYIVQVRFVNRNRRGGLSDPALGLSLEIVDSDPSQTNKRIDAALLKIQKLRVPPAEIGSSYRYKLSFKELRVDGRPLSLSLLETRGFDNFGLSCRVEKDSVYIEGAPEQEYDGKLDFYITGRFRYHYMYNGRTRIPGEFKFSNVHLEKTWSIREMGVSTPESSVAGENDSSDAQGSDSGAKQDADPKIDYGNSTSSGTSSRNRPTDAISTGATSSGFSASDFIASSDDPYDDEDDASLFQPSPFRR